MLTIVVVDDENLERKALTKIINTQCDKAKVIGEAANGKAAVEMAAQLKPDIIFMDIKMPGLNGLEAIQKIKPSLPGTKFVMVSAFDTFEYAKQAMRMGVKEYILKPSRKEDILSSLHRVCDEIAEEREQDREKTKLQASFDHALNFAQKEWVTSLLSNPIHDTSLEEISVLLGMDIKAGYSIIFSLCGNEKTSGKIGAFLPWLEENLHQATDDHPILGSPIEGEVPVLMLCRSKYEAGRCKSNAQSLVRTITNKFSSAFPSSRLLAGVGEPYDSAKDFPKSFKEAYFAVQELKETKQRNYSFARKEQFSDQEQRTNYDLEKNLLEAIIQGDLKGAVQYYEEFTQHAMNSAKNDLSLMKVSFQELAVIITRTLHDLSLDYGQKIAFEEYSDIPSLQAAGKAQILSITQYVQAWRSQHTKGLLQKAKEYVEQNYVQHLTLEEVSEHVELSPFYFSKLFKERFGSTFIDYITELRLKQAKREMAESAKSLKEISYSVGYKDPNYFSRVFKRHTGLSPKEYRKRCESSVQLAVKAEDS